MSSFRVLFLEDVPMDVEIVQEQLIQANIDCEFSCVETEEQFVGALDNSDFDIILADYSLPSFDGLSALQIANKRCPDVPFILISGVLGEELAIETLKQGATDYVLKQRMERLVPAVLRAIRESRERLALRQAQADFKASEERFKTSVESMLDCFSIFKSVRDESGQIVDFVTDYVNDAACETHQRSRQEQVGRRISEFWPVIFSSGLFEELRQVVETGQPLVKKAVSLEEPSDGDVSRAFDVHVTQLQDSVVVIWRDVTDQVRAAEEREELLSREQSARQEAEQGNRIKDEFLTTLSHELRTPLNAIFGWSQLLTEGQLNQAQQERAIETVQRNARSLVQIIEDILDVSRIIRGKLRLNAEPTNLKPIVADTLETVALAARAKDIRVETALSEDTGNILGDPGRLQQITWNLLSNAIKFTPKGGYIEVRLDQADSNVMMQVTDTGCGIPPESLPNIFNRFYQTDSKTTRTKGGLGLGLAIVRHLAELQGGTVHADSPGEGQGSTFTVSFPVIAVSLSNDDMSTGADTNRKSSLILDGLRVLAVDDEADARALISLILEQVGVTVETAASAEEALMALSEFEPDILISDIGMPNEDGYTLARRVRSRYADSDDKRIPMVALTAYARRSDRQLALDAGFDYHISKPVEPAELISVLAKISK